MAEPLESTWASRDLPILRAALRRFDAKGLADFPELESDTGLNRDEVWAGLRALRDADPPYLDLQGNVVVGVRERARRELGAWPSADDLLNRLVAALEEAAAEEGRPDEEKGRLRTAATTLAGMAREIAVGVIVGRLGRF